MKSKCIAIFITLVISANAQYQPYNSSRIDLSDFQSGGTWYTGYYWRTEGIVPNQGRWWTGTSNIWVDAESPWEYYHGEWYGDGVFNIRYSHRLFDPQYIGVSAPVGSNVVWMDNYDGGDTQVELSFFENLMYRVAEENLLNDRVKHFESWGIYTNWVGTPITQLVRAGSSLYESKRGKYRQTLIQGHATSKANYMYNDRLRTLPGRYDVGRVCVPMVVTLTNRPYYTNDWTPPSEGAKRARVKVKWTFKNPTVYE